VSRNGKAGVRRERSDWRATAFPFRRAGGGDAAEMSCDDSLGDLFRGLGDKANDLCIYFAGPIDLCRSSIAQGLMWSPSVVALKPLLQTSTKLDDGGVFKEVNVLVFYAAPKPLNAQ